MKSVSTGKLFQMITTRSVKNEERATGMLCVQFIGVTPASASGYPP